MQPIFFFFIYRSYFMISWTRTIHRWAGKGRGLSWFVTIRFARRLFAVTYLRCLRRTFNHCACHCQTSTWWDLKFTLKELAFVWTLILHVINLSLANCGFEVTSIITPVLQMQRLAKWARHLPVFSPQLIKVSKW